MTLYGPFIQLLTMDQLPLKGPLADEQLEIITHAGIVVNENIIVDIANFDWLKTKYSHSRIDFSGDNFICLPAFTDAHTHIAWAGSRAADYASRTAGKSYLEIAAAGGGIMETVRHTRAAGVEELVNLTAARANELVKFGTTTIEVKSGYGLSVKEELKLLEVIRQSASYTAARLVPTCLAAHTRPTDFKGTTGDYLKMIVDELLPEVKKQNLCNRVDIFVEQGAFTIDEARNYLTSARSMGFDSVIHGDQFSRGAAALAIELGTLSIDHLEAADDAEIELLSTGNTIPVVLPGSSLGLGEPFAPARKLLDAGTSLAIASDWNPGSAPMGNLIAQAAVLGAAQRLTMAEVLAALTCRAAAALGIHTHGILKKGMQADFSVFRTNDYREVLYRQGALKPVYSVAAGNICTGNVKY